MKIYYPIIGFLILVSCKENKSIKSNIDEFNKIKIDNYIEVVTTGMDFDMVDSVNSGWTTFKYVNNSYETHFFILEKMPDSLGLEDYKRDLFPPFKSAFEHFEKGEIEEGMKEFEKIPEWFYRVELAGGVGLTSKKTTSKSTIFLEPGTYVMECYVRMPNGMPHTFLGMVKELTVIDESNNIEEPKADHNIVISSENGLTFKDSLKVGNYNFSVKFEDQKLYEHFLGHDVNLVKIENDTLLNTLGNWINSSDLKSFRTPSPKGLTFLGGVEDLPANKTGYFEANLEKGKYILISEIPNSVERNMFKFFTVY